MITYNELKNLGYTLVRSSEEICSFIFENKDRDTNITVDYNPDHLDDDCYVIHAHTISTDTDWFGNENYLPIGLSRKETMAVIAVMDRFMEENKND